MTQQIGVIGLAAMGKNPVWSIESHGYSVSVFNRSSEKTDSMVEELKGKNIHPTHSLEEFANSLEKPRKILLMVQAGKATDAMIDSSLPLLSDGDILIDGGDTNYQGTTRRNKALAQSAINFIGTGASGGEVGALTGPSLMPGGQEEACNKAADILDVIAAKAEDGASCVIYIGPNGAEHYVKMAHNGIEHAGMQLTAESYAMMKKLLGISHENIAQTLKDWNAGELENYLIEIVDDIFMRLDEDKEALVEKVLDTASQKDTGKWTSINALELDTPLTIITESIFARFISSIKEEHVNASRELNGSKASFDGDKKDFLEKIRETLCMSKICSYAQGFTQMRKASGDNEWNLKLDDLTMIWREGCIICTQFLQKIKDAYNNNPGLQNLLLDPYFKNVVTRYQDAPRDVVVTDVQNGVSTPDFSSSTNYCDSYRAADLPTNLIRAQRDYFGTHTYERRDKEGVFHTQWIEE